MGKTYKKYNSWFRNPRGKIQAMANDARPGAVPPDSWDDIPTDRSANISRHAATRMLKRGLPLDKIRKKLKFKFKLNNYEIEDCIECAQIYQTSSKLAS